jgi:hypothetical protein
MKTCEDFLTMTPKELTNYLEQLHRNMHDAIDALMAKQAMCAHSWGKEKYEPFISPEFIYDGADGRLGDFIPGLVIPKKEIPHWIKTCMNCLKEEEITHHPEKAEKKTWTH